MNSCAGVISVKGSCFSLVGSKIYLLGEKENKKILKGVNQLLTLVVLYHQGVLLYKVKEYT